MKSALIIMLVCLLMMSLILIWDIKMAEELLQRIYPIRHKERKTIGWREFSTLLNFSIEFIEPINDNEFKTWFVIYNENMDRNKNKTPYTLFYSKKHGKNYEIPKLTIEESFEDLKTIQPYFFEILTLFQKTT